MKYRVERTSYYSDRPCEEAILFTGEVVLQNIRTCSLEDAKLKFWGNDFFSNGFGHVDLPDNQCMRKIKSQESFYYVDLDTIEDLQKFISTHGQVVVSYDTKYEDWEWLIEIYDDYRE